MNDLQKDETMNPMREQLNNLSTLLDAMAQLNRLHDFIEKADVESRLRWAVKNTADKIHILSSLKG